MHIVELILLLMISILSLSGAAGPFPPTALSAMAQFKCMVLIVWGHLLNEKGR